MNANALAKASTRHWLANIETGVNYALVLSNNAGMWSYILGDTVRFIGTDPPRVVITGRTSYTLSAVGEHLIGEEIEAAVLNATRTLGLEVGEYAVGALYPAEERRTGHHLYLLECEPGGEEQAIELAAQLAKLIDADLKERNDDYRTERQADLAFGPPQVRFVPGGAFVEWLRSRDQLGGQHKVPRVLPDPNAFMQLVDWMTAYSP